MIMTFMHNDCIKQFNRDVAKECIRKQAALKMSFTDVWKSACNVC